MPPTHARLTPMTLIRRSIDFLPDVLIMAGEYSRRATLGVIAGVGMGRTTSDLDPGDAPDGHRLSLLIASPSSNG